MWGILSQGNLSHWLSHRRQGSFPVCSFLPPKGHSVMRQKGLWSGWVWGFLRKSTTQHKEESLDFRTDQVSNPTIKLDDLRQITSLL